jgi:hypothetical protein
VSRPSIYWCFVLISAGIFLVFMSQIQRIEEAQQQSRRAIRASQHSLWLADHRQGEIDALRSNCTELQEALDAEMERLEFCVQDNARIAGQALP